MAENRSFGEWVEYLWHESLERHVVIRNSERVAFDLPLLVVIIAAVVAPWLAAGAVVVALIVGYRLEMTRPNAAQPETDGTVTTMSEAGMVTNVPPSEAPAPPVVPEPPTAETPPMPGEAAQPPVPPVAPSEPGTVSESGTLPGEPEEQEPPR